MEPIGAFIIAIREHLGFGSQRIHPGGDGKWCENEGMMMIYDVLRGLDAICDRHCGRRGGFATLRPCSMFLA